MTSVPLNARSEFVTPAKPCGAGVCETMRRFQIASPASWSPALRPTRGSGDGATTSGCDMSGPEPDDMGDMPALVQAAAARARVAYAKRDFIDGASGGCADVWTYGRMDVWTGGRAIRPFLHTSIPPISGPPTSAPFDRSPSTDRPGRHSRT